MKNDNKTPGKAFKLSVATLAIMNITAVGPFGMVSTGLHLCCDECPTMHFG